ANWRETGVFLIEPDLLGTLSKVPPVDWSRDTMPALIAEGRVFGWPSPAAFATVPEIKLLVRDLDSP
ncbi:MAG: hypothetical protein QF652_03200, partial [Dehalococcoidia bacterium]|nr:hypothetical protein [Dehalococcoidia bacterium]